MSEKLCSSAVLSPSEVEMISRALKDCGRLDLAALIEDRSGIDPEYAVYLDQARKWEGDDLTFDEQPVVSVSTDGAFVSAWVWVPLPDEKCDAA